MMAIDCSPNLRGKLENLSIGSSPDTLESVSSAKQPVLSTRSLLSKTLANEGSNSEYSPERYSFQVDDFQAINTEGHPEPSLLATSVGKDHDGRLIPSSSTISLLSLNNNMSGSQVLAAHSEAANLGAKSPVAGLNMGNPERVASYTNLRSRNSITHMGHQRLQPYHNLSSPVVPASGDFNAISSPKTIPWVKGQASVPDSPNLHPTSIGESPSRFWLSAQTPPQAQTNPHLRQRGSVSALGGLTMTPYHPANSDKQTRPQAINITRGSDSPILNPVQTPLEGMPMTPLYLSSENGYFVSAHGPRDSGERQRDYFSTSGPMDTQHEREQFQCDTEDTILE